MPILKDLLINKSSVPKEFNKIASRYDLATSLSQGYQEDLENSAALLLLKGDETVLDLCCGTGKSTRAILPKITSGKIIGIDNSEQMLEHAREKFKEPISSGKVEFKLMDAMQLDLPDNSVDAIFMAYGLRNMPDYTKCINNLHRILKPGGQLVIHDYSLAEVWYARLLWKVLGYGFIVPFCTLLSGSATIYIYLVKSVLDFLQPAQAAELLRISGFRDIEILRHKSWRKLILHTFSAFKK
jgi:ubiquinone/menaquinone biosynthesis methyltransferase